MSLDEYFAANRANWDERAAIHVRSQMYDVEGFIAGTRIMGASNRQEDIEGAGDVTGKTLLHLQCHIGLDTLAWARRGAKVTGLDLSPQSVAAAREIAERAGIDDARFVEANVYDAVEALGGEQFDVVFTGVGALNWLPDVLRWAAVVGRLLKPGGVFYMREFHPMLATIDDEDPERRLLVRYPYFETVQPQAWDDADTYTDNPEGRGITATRTYEWSHGLGEVVTGLIDNGLRIEFLREYDWCEARVLPWLVEDGEGRWMLREGRERLPLSYAVRAVKA